MAGDKIKFKDGVVVDEDLSLYQGGVKITASAAELNLVDGLTSSLSGLTATASELNNLDVTALAAEHGAGVIGTAATPATYRWEDHGVIITQTKIDLTGLASVATANDVIGLAAGGNAYLRQHVVATDGVIFKTEFSCLETPVGGDLEVNVVRNSSGTLAYDGAGGTAYISDSGSLVIGQTIQNLVPAVTANHYIYLTGGAGNAAAAYTAGMFILTTYGHPVLS